MVVWPMVEFEADDALASGAGARRARSPGAERVIDLHAGQGSRAVRAWHARRAAEPPDCALPSIEAGVIHKFGVEPASIPDYLALVGDAADGYPGLPGWGAKSASAVLRKFHHLDRIPADPDQWSVDVSRAAELARTLVLNRDKVFLFRALATLKTGIPLFDSVA